MPGWYSFNRQPIDAAWLKFVVRGRLFICAAFIHLVLQFEGQQFGGLSIAVATAQAPKGYRGQVLTLKRVASFQISSAPIIALRFSGDGKALMALYKSGEVCVWDVAMHRRLKRLRCAKRFISVGAFSNDAKLLACAGADQVVRVYESATGKEVANIRGHGGEIRQISFSPDGQLLAIAYEGCCNMPGDTRLWETRTGKLLCRFSGDAFSVTFMGSNKLIAVGGRQFVTVWDVNDVKVVRKLQIGLRVNSICFLGERKLLVIATVDGVHAFAFPNWSAKALIRATWASSLSHSPNGSLLAVGTRNGITIIDTIRWSIVHQIGGHEDSVTSVAFAPNGALLATAGANGMIILWKVEQQKSR
ncbi:MAG: WD40 repeat domain-containing protein [Armatimonadota bacterium]|nr:WD40 repeat domain-containing protein [Armatimonadota bacterium]MCX7776589.1 WD40 repeat domain-containing protein [Armatimonadota bacterium]MDW8025268.1 WD40 repeat domain-containing protein [Armatimonadota bacterium]